MKKGRFLLLVGLFAFGSLAKAQNYAFQVIVNKGANEVKSGSNWQPIKTGATLNLSDEIKLSENASVGLVHAKGKPLEVRKPGVHKVSELASQIGVETSVLNKYADFILSSNTPEAKKNRLAATGAVTRDITAKVIRPLLPGNQDADIFGNQLVINWETESAGPYIVTVLDMFDETLYKAETSEKSLAVDLTDAKFNGQDALIIDIRSKTTGAKLAEDTRPMVKRLSPAKSEKIKTSYAEVSKELDANSAFGNLFLAGFFEQNRLIVDAIAAYERAIALAPDDPTYKEYYEEFQFRNKLKPDPAAAKNK
ncbi:MAG: hypothetical protein KIT62_00090 [Cyclobacteriaceae bacterium]|nr:hypothetical protein [Cyclobacteriaceae bacterium]